MHRVYADAKNLDIQRPQFIVMLGELSEFSHAVRSPEAAVEIDQDDMAGEVRKSDGFASGGGKRKIRSLLADFDTERQNARATLAVGGTCSASGENDEGREDTTGSETSSE